MKVQKTREAILDAAINLFNSRLASNVSTVQIACEIGISPGNLYYYFDNKEEIIRCIWSERIMPDVDKLFDSESNIMTTAQLLNFMNKVSMHYEKYFFYYNEKYLLEFNDQSLTEINDCDYEDRLAYVIMNMIDNFINSGMTIKINESEKILVAESLWATICMSMKYFFEKTKGGRDCSPMKLWKKRFLMILDCILTDEYGQTLRNQAKEAGIVIDKYYDYMSSMCTRPAI